MCQLAPPASPCCSSPASSRLFRASCGAVRSIEQCSARAHDQRCGSSPPLLCFTIKLLCASAAARALQGRLTLACATRGWTAPPTTAPPPSTWATAARTSRAAACRAATRLSRSTSTASPPSSGGSSTGCALRAGAMRRCAQAHASVGLLCLLHESLRGPEGLFGRCLCPPSRLQLRSPSLRSHGCSVNNLWQAGHQCVVIFAYPLWRDRLAYFSHFCAFALILLAAPHLKTLTPHAAAGAQCLRQQRPHRCCWRAEHSTRGAWWRN